MKTVLKLPLLLAVMLLAGCTTNPFATAQTPEQKGDALYGEYVIAKEGAGGILDSPSVPDNIKRNIATMMLTTSKPANSLHDATIMFSEERAKVLLGQSTQERLLIAAQNLDRWITDAGPLIDSFKSAVDGVK